MNGVTQVGSQQVQRLKDKREHELKDILDCIEYEVGGKVSSWRGKQT